MNDGINRIPPIRPAGFGVKAAGNVDRDKLDQGGGSVTDRIEIDPDRVTQTSDKKEDISLSVSTIRIIASGVATGNLDPNIEAALTAFAPLGDLRDAERLCDMLDKRNVEFITWPPDLSLAQALDAAVART